ncbi:MAG TPA: cupin domain-containing protein [Bacteroidota bacterium]|nr:cupin domain-containing protein [Bacteroidota bacterium]
MNTANILTDLPPKQHEEFLETLVENGNIRIERIASHGHTSPEGFWYDQESNEWVMVVQGSARIEFKDGRSEAFLSPGGYVFLPAHCKHRVVWTDENTIWLAVHWPV